MEPLALPTLMFSVSWMLTTPSDSLRNDEVNGEPPSSGRSYSAESFGWVMFRRI